MLKFLVFVLVILTIGLFGYRYLKNNRQALIALEKPANKTLEDQINALSDLGIKMNKGVIIDNLLVSWSRADYEHRPFNTILFEYGSEVEREPLGRNVCDRVWNFDVECIEGEGSYVAIVNRLALLAGMRENLTEVRDAVDFESGQAWVSYQLNGESRKYQIKIDDDWADANVVAAIMKDLKKPGMRFYAKDNGQASVWFYLDEATAGEINKLSGNALKAS